MDTSVTITVNLHDLRTVLDQQQRHSHRVPGLWDSDGLPCNECAARARMQALVAANSALTGRAS